MLLSPLGKNCDAAAFPRRAMARAGLQEEVFLQFFRLHNKNSCALWTRTEVSSCRRVGWIVDTNCTDLDMCVCVFGGGMFHSRSSDQHWPKNTEEPQSARDFATLHPCSPCSPCSPRSVPASFFPAAQAKSAWPLPIFRSSTCVMRRQKSVWFDFNLFIHHSQPFTTIQTIWQTRFIVGLNNDWPSLFEVWKSN